MNFSQILNKYRKYSFSERDKGDKFERLMKAYLLTDPKYATKLKTVWLWNEFPGRKDFGGQDIGIDLVAQTVEGDFWAIQCKCYLAETTIDKPEVDSFLATSGRSFLNDELKTVNFSHRFWISTTNKWGSNAEESIHNQRPPVSRINLHDLLEAPVDWEKLDSGIFGAKSRRPKKEILPHQRNAVELSHEYFKSADRGKMIMACGTGKTFTALKIAEKETNNKGLVLYLVPSIALLGQILNEWSSDASKPINPVCICSDPKVSQKGTKNEDSDTSSVVDLALPASTDTKSIARQLRYIREKKAEGMTVVFSTYQSIETISAAQSEIMKADKSFGIFDMIVCDEAHRTTGVALTKEDSSAFIKVHDNDFIKARKRLYMTATPRLYSDEAKGKAVQAEAILCSMDDEPLYGTEIYRLGFGEAVEKDLLSDYKVLILTLNDNDVPPVVQKMIAGKDNEINSDDATKLIGCLNALSKQIIGDDGAIRSADPGKMKRAVAFCQNISVSKKITEIFNSTSEAYVDSLPMDKKEQMVDISSRHIDGTMTAPKRDELMSWLKSEMENPDDCKVLTNVRCLSEGVDVPSLDAVLFLSPRNSQVEVVQSVGRVMRKAQGKKYGYIVIPVVIPVDVEPDKALDDNERYKVVWSVLNALRAHDDRFNATVNKIDLNKTKPMQILVGRPTNTFVDGKAEEVLEGAKGKNKQLIEQLTLQFQQLQGIVFARMVQKVGDRRYWEQWAKNVAEVAEKQNGRIKNIVNQDGKHRKVFEEFLGGLRKNINPSITQDEAIEMLSQHVITSPVFEALFKDYLFVKNNPISVSMQKMLDILDAHSIEKDTESLSKFYESVNKRAEGIDNAEGKQRVIIELYDKFFKTAFPKMAEKLGIVYTPVEVVDFIIHSVSFILKKEFDRSLSDENVHILDPFTGTGTFVTRLIQSGLIDKKSLNRKYEKEIHANEIVLLAYYIAAINIENAYVDALGNEGSYKPFDGICLTDTFQLGESDESDEHFAKMFPQNSERVSRQKKAPLRIIMGNPPYSVGQKSANDNAQNQSYSVLEKRIAETYAAGTDATNKNSLYDSYIKAYRWSSDRLDKKHGGIIAFVSNGAWLDGNATEGFRKCLEKEFTSIYVFNLRGNARTQGELRRKEAGSVFGAGTRTPIAITFLIKKPDVKTEKATIYYHDIGDYLSREEKLSIVKKYGSAGNPEFPWIILKPNEHGDWISMRNDAFENFIPIESDKKFDANAKSFFIVNSRGNETARDAWVYNSSKNTLESNMEQTVSFYNEQVNAFQKAWEKNKNIKPEDFIDTNPCKISWSSSLIQHLTKFDEAVYEPDKFVLANYRPFFKQHLYLGDKFIHRRGQFKDFFNGKGSGNLVICVSGVGVTKDFSAIITDIIPDLELIGKSQCFPLYYYEENQDEQKSLFDTDDESNSKYIRRDGVSDFILEQAKKIYGKSVSKEDIFYYVYGFLHSPEYQTTFANDLKKMLPRLPLVDEPKDFWKFSKAGRALAELHINYEKVPAYDGVTVEGAKKGIFKVEKMRFPQKGQKDAIIFNSHITISNIPAKAYEYVVNGRSAIEWIMERYQITTHTDSRIKNDPNDWADEVGNPRYILDLLLSIINVSVKTVEIVEGLQKIKFG